MTAGEGGAVVWFTGLPAAGKTTLAAAVKAVLMARGNRVEILDGDEVRRILGDIRGFSREERDANVRRLGWAAGLLARNGVLALVSAVSPYRKSREEARGFAPVFIEVYVRCPVEVCSRRDPKGLYAKAAAGQLKGMTGIDDPYEPPTAAEVVVDTDRESVEACTAAVLKAFVAGIRGN